MCRYKAAAEQCERDGQFQKAVALHEQCMAASRASGDELSAGLACVPLCNKLHVDVLSMPHIMTVAFVP
jgi:hypothetical protein